MRRIVIDPNQRMHAVARVEDQMRPFIKRDSVVSIRRQFGVAGAAYIDIQRGVGPALVLLLQRRLQRPQLVSFHALRLSDHVCSTRSVLPKALWGAW